jgi:hypothetical protein
MFVCVCVCQRPEPPPQGRVRSPYLEAHSNAFRYTATLSVTQQRFPLHCNAFRYTATLSVAFSRNVGTPVPPRTSRFRAACSSLRAKGCTLVRSSVRAYSVLRCVCTVRNSAYAYCTELVILVGSPTRYSGFQVLSKGAREVAGHICPRVLV